MKEGEEEEEEEGGRGKGEVVLSHERYDDSRRFKELVKPIK